MNRIKELREKYKYTVKELADKLNVSVRTYYNIEKEISPVSASTIDRLTKIYNVTSDYLLGIVDFNAKESKEEKEKEDLIETISDIFK